MRVEPLLLALLVAIAGSGPAQAVSITIDFEGFSASFFPSGPDFSAGVEDGVSITATGDSPEVARFFEPNQLAMSTGVAPGSTTWTFTRVGGGVFTFESVDFWFWVFVEGPATGLIVVQGFLSGAQQGALGPVLGTTSWQTLASGQLLGVPLDALVITLLNQSGSGMMGMDNIVLNVPEPGALGLLAFGLLGAGVVSARRWRPAARARAFRARR